MLDGGLLCARRHSEATPKMRPSIMKSATAASSALRLGSETSPASTIPVLLKNTATAVLKSAATDSFSLICDNLLAPHSGRLVHIGADFQYLDSAAAFIGQGSYGVVYKGLQRSTGKGVAIKKIWRINVKPDELEAMKCVRNKHLVSLIDVFDESLDVTYVVMELCDTDLDRYLRVSASGGCLKPTEMMTVVESIARGYYALYKKHIVHRDIKPQNILLLLDENRIRSAKITDFGVSRVLDDDTMGLCNVAGTLFYMAPEVGANLVVFSEYNAEADMWSVGVLFYQCLTGKVPFEEPSLCRMFLHCAGENYDAYELPELPTPNASSAHHDFRPLITNLLEIDHTKRLTPSQLYQAVSDELDSLSPKATKKNGGGIIEIL